jgi:hypothetical protein
MANNITMDLGISPMAMIMLKIMASSVDQISLTTQIGRPEVIVGKQGKFWWQGLQGLHEGKCAAAVSSYGKIAGRSIRE